MLLLPCAINEREGPDFPDGQTQTGTRKLGMFDPLSDQEELIWKSFDQFYQNDSTSDRNVSNNDLYHHQLKQLHIELDLFISF